MWVRLRSRSDQTMTHRTNLLTRLRKWLISRNGLPAKLADPTSHPQDLSLAELQRASNLAWAEERAGDLARYNDEIRRRDPRRDWHCLRCGHDRFEESGVRIAGGRVSSILDIATAKFHTITCRSCGFTGFYKVLMPVSEALFDFMAS